MTSSRALARRVVFAVVAAYLVLSVMFFFVAFTPDWNLRGRLGSAAFAGANESELAQIRETYIEARGRDRPLVDRYVGWMVDVTTLQWGYSHTRNAPVWDLIVDRLGRTVRYVVPGMALAVVGGLGVGLYSATHRRSRAERAGRVLAYLALGVPNFWIGMVALLLTLPPGPGLGEPTLSPTLRFTVLPVVLVAASLFAGQLSYARAESLEYVDTEFVKLVRAKGASRLRVARHVLRNAALPIFSLFFTDLLAVLLLNVYVVEFVFGIRGFGRLSYFAVRQSDVPLILGTTMFVILVGVFGNLVQDLAYSAFDPRVDAGE